MRPYTKKSLEKHAKNSQAGLKLLPLWDGGIPPFSFAGITLASLGRQVFFFLLIDSPPIPLLFGTAGFSPDWPRLGAATSSAPDWPRLGAATSSAPAIRPPAPPAEGGPDGPRFRLRRERNHFPAALAVFRRGYRGFYGEEHSGSILDGRLAQCCNAGTPPPPALARPALWPCLLSDFSLVIRKGHRGVGLGQPRGSRLVPLSIVLHSLLFEVSTWTPSPPPPLHYPKAPLGM